MRRSRTVKGDTFQEWKAKKDLEARQSKLDAIHEHKEIMRKNDAIEKERIKKNEAIKSWLRTKQDSPTKTMKSSPTMESTRTFFPDEQKTRKSSKEKISKENKILKENKIYKEDKKTEAEKQREADITEFYSVKRDANLTFSQWLQRKEEDRLAKIREKEAKLAEKEAEELEKQEQSKRAVQEWMVKTKYRTLTRHYPKLNEQEINNRIWQDLKI